MDRDLPAVLLALRGLRSGSITRPRTGDPRVAALRSLQGEPDADDIGGAPDMDTDDKYRPLSGDEVMRRQDADEAYIDGLSEAPDEMLSPTERVELSQGYRLRSEPQLREDEVRLRDGRVMPVDDALGRSATMTDMEMQNPDGYGRGTQRPNLAIEIRTARGGR